MVFDLDFNSDDKSPTTTLCTSRHGISTAALFLFFLVVILPLAAAQNTNIDTLGSSDPYARFNPSMAIIVVILVAAFFFMAFFSVYLRHCSDTTIDSNRPMAVQRSQRAAAAARGIESSVIQTFPTFAYSEVKDLKYGKGVLECAVCLSEFQEDETLRLIPKCDHVFHPDCIDTWLASHTTCPVCRADLVPDVEAQHDRIQLQPMEQEVMMLNRNRSISGRPSKFPKSHSTGHSSLVQPGEDTERFTLRLPVEVRKQIMANRALNRAMSMVALPREGAWERNSMRYRRLESFGEVVKSERWVFTMAPPFLVRESSMNSPDLGTRRTPSFIARVLSLKLAKQQEAGTSSALCPVIDKSQMTDSGKPLA